MLAGKLPDVGSYVSKLKRNHTNFFLFVEVHFCAVVTPVTEADTGPLHTARTAHLETFVDDTTPGLLSLSLKKYLQHKTTHSNTAFRFYN